MRKVLMNIHENTDDQRSNQNNLWITYKWENCK
jgi:hypothetical protein